MNLSSGTLQGVRCLDERQKEDEHGAGADSLRFLLPELPSTKLGLHQPSRLRTLL